jgi:hypothetical protein
MENNNLNELEQLKAQYETLKEQLDQQEIVNDRLMKSSVKHSVDFYKRYRWLQVISYPFLAFLGLVFFNWYLDGSFSAKVFWVTFCLAGLIIELLLTRKLQLKTLENEDLLTLSNHARGFKRLFSLFLILNYSTVMIVVGGFLMSKIGEGVANLGVAMLLLGIVMVFVIIVGIWEIRFKTKPCDEIVRQLEAIGTPTEKKPVFYMNQRWFIIAMMVVYLSLDVWCGYLFASHLKLVGETINYERAEGDLTTKGSLEIWEVDHWIRVSDKERFLETTKVEDNDSLVYRWSADTTDLMLYTLKKTTEVGPAISSAVLGGKPLIKRMDSGPYKEGTFTAILIGLMPEATILFRRMTEDALLQPNPVHAAIVIDGLVYQDWRITGVIECGVCYINANPNWSKEEVETFCNRLIKQ